MALCAPFFDIFDLEKYGNLEIQLMGHSVSS